MGKHRRPNLKIFEIGDALWASGGFVSHAAKQLGVCQSTISNRIAKSVELQKILREVENTYLDLAETQLIKGIRAGDNACIFFYLKCKGKHRGYVEKQVIQADVNLSHDMWVRRLNEPE